MIRRLHQHQPTLPDDHIFPLEATQEVASWWEWHLLLLLVREPLRRGDGLIPFRFGDGLHDTDSYEW